MIRPQTMTIPGIVGDAFGKGGDFDGAVDFSDRRMKQLHTSACQGRWPEFMEIIHERITPNNYSP